MSGALASVVLFAATFTCPLERVVTLDPALAQAVYDSRAIQLVYETPLAVDYEARPYTIVPGFCDLPDISEDGLTYRFRVRPHRRMGLTAQDAVRSLERLRDPDVLSPNAWMLKDVETIRALHDAAFEIRLKRRVRHFPWLMTLTGACVVGKDGAGSGPYRLAAWRKNHEMVFERRETDSVGFDTVRYCVIDDASTQWLMFLKGELDMLGEIARDNWDMVVGPDGRLTAALSQRGIRLYQTPTLESLYLGVNMEDPVLGPNRALRQALNCAFDRAAWERYANGRVTGSDGPIPPGVPERLETPFAYASDLAKAKRLMVEAGYPEGVDPKTGRRLVLHLAIGRASQESREAGELTAAFFARVGIRLELDFMTWEAFLKAVNERRVQLFRMDWVGDYPDAQNFMQLFYSKNVSPGCNHANFRNAAFDAAYEREDFRTCQEIVREECPWVFMNYTKAYSLAGPRVGHYVPSAFPYGSEQHYEYIVH